MGRQSISTAVVLFYITAGLGCFVGWSSAMAQSSLLSAGKKALDEGKTDKAIELLTKAVKSSEMTSEEIAEALYMRGLAYKKQKKTAAAIADLNGALFIKSLPSKDRQQALKARAEIFSSLGQTQRAASDLKQAANTSTEVTKSVEVSKPVASQSLESDASTKNSRSASQTVENKVQNQHENQVRDSTQLASGFETKTVKNSTLNNSSNQSSQSGTGAFSGVTSFFKSLISPTAKPESQKQAGSTAKKTETASASKKSPDSAASWSFQTNVSPDNLKTASLPDQKVSEPVPQRSALDTSTRPQQAIDPAARKLTQKTAKSQPAKSKPAVSYEVGKNGTKPISKKNEDKRNLKQVQRVASKTVEPPALKVEKPEGQYRLKLASTRDVDEAIETWKRLSANHRDLLKGRNGEIQQVETADSGTIYNVRIGPFSDEALSVKLCNEFRQRGVGCDLSNR